MLKEHFNPIVILFAICAGISIGFFISQFRYFVFDQELNIIEILNLVVTMLLGVYISTSLSKKVTANRIEKDLIISEINSIKEICKELDDHIASNAISFAVILPIFKNLSSSLSHLKTVSKLCNHTIDNEITQIYNQVLMLKRITTGGASASATSTYQLTRQELSSYQLQFNQQKLSLYSLTITINRQ